MPGLRFLSMDTMLTVERNDTVFTAQVGDGRRYSARQWPMATAITPPTAETLDRLEGENLVAFRYADGNRNGAARDIAGIYSPNLRILGLMPHPEDLVDPLIGGTDGKPLFDSLAAA